MATGDLEHELHETLAKLQRTMDRCVLGIYGGMDPDTGLPRDGLISRLEDLSRRVHALETRRNHSLEWLRGVAFLGIGVAFGKIADWASSHLK